MEPEIRPSNLITLQHVYSTVETPHVDFSQISKSGTQISVFICADDNKPMRIALFCSN